MMGGKEASLVEETLRSECIHVNCSNLILFNMPTGLNAKENTYIDISSPVIWTNTITYIIYFVFEILKDKTL